MAHLNRVGFTQLVSSNETPLQPRCLALYIFLEESDIHVFVTDLRIRDNL